MPPCMPKYSKLYQYILFVFASVFISISVFKFIGIYILIITVTGVLISTVLSKLTSTFPPLAIFYP